METKKKNHLPLSPSSPLEVSVIIPAYTEERWQDLVDSVEGVQKQTRRPKEIILVIDHNPKLLALAKNTFKNVMILENAEDRGVSGSRNTGIKAATGEIIAFVDDDAVAAPDWLEKLIPLYHDPRVIGVGGTIVASWLDTRPDWFPREFDWVVGCTYLGLPETISPVRNLIGCNMSYRKAAFETVGHFRSGIGRIGKHPVGCDETEFCIRLSQLMEDKVFLYQPAARVYHRVSAARRSWRYFQARCYAEGISKARISRMVGKRDSLSTEQAYTISTLPRGILRGLKDGFSRRNLTGFARAGAIIAGLAITVAGYLFGSLTQKG